MSELLEAEALHKTYTNGAKPLHVIKGVSLKLKKGEAVSIVGPSGAGKSTLLHLLGGLDAPDSGKVFIDGEDIYKLQDSRRSELRNKRVGFVFQFYHLLPEFSALENVMLPGLIRGRRGGLKDKAAELLSAVGLKDRATHRPSQLSGGEQQRVAIARALMNEPDILLCDEPTGNLDSKTSLEICELLWRLNEEQGKTLVIVTHEKEIAARADRMIYMRDGVFE